MIRFYILLPSLLFLSIGLANAQTFEEKKQEYAVSLSDGHRIVTGFQDFSGLNDEQILANAMKWSINEYCDRERNHLADVKIDKKSFTINMGLDYVEEGKTKYKFECQWDIKIQDNKLVYTLHDICYKTNSLLSFSSVNYLDKLNPEKKSKHKDIIKAFQYMASTKLNQLFDAVVSNKCAPISHWNDINFQRPVKGMNEDECFIAFGKPSNNYEDNYGRIQWSYGLNFVLIFKEGVLDTIIR